MSESPLESPLCYLQEMTGSLWKSGIQEQGFIMPYYEVSLCIRSVIEKEEAGLFILGWVNGGTHMGKPLILASLVIIKA